MNPDTATRSPRRRDPRGKASSKPSKPIRTWHVLVADDEELIRRLISYSLAKIGVSVTAVSDGHEAWEALCQGHYDLLVTDNEMPQLTGVKLIERIRKAGMSLPVIMASGSFSVASVPDHLQHQIAAVITKPFGMFEFLNVVRNVLSPQGATLQGGTVSNRSHGDLRSFSQPDESNPKLCHH